MSSLLIFDADKKKAGEIIAMFDRGWMLTGNPNLTGGGSTTLTLTESQARNELLQFGRSILVTHSKLPNWAGVIDPPWNVTPPVQTAIYNAEYLLSMRSPDAPIVLTGTVANIVSKILEMCNQYRDLFVRLGDTSRADQTVRSVNIDNRNLWEQLKSFLTRSSCEMQVRSQIDADGRLINYIDLAQQMGITTNFLYYTGENGNATLAGGTLDGPIINKVIGVNNASGQDSRLYTSSYRELESIKLYGMRSEVAQFDGVQEQSTLDRYTQNYLSARSFPSFSFVLSVLDKGDAFMNARLGNIAMVHIPEARLSGGKVGWRGLARILAMAYTESQNLLSIKMITI